MLEERRQLYISLNLIENIGYVRTKNLLNVYNNLKELRNAKKEELLKISNISYKIAEKILYSLKNINPLKELEKANKIGAEIITIEDEGYPDLLKEIYDPPTVIYVKGKKDLLKQKGIAIVGTRKPTEYGKKVAEELARELAENNLSIVSGLAKGIDAFAHKGALKADGNTIAVLGTGIDIIYPFENKKLFEEISEKGVIITTFPIGTKPLPYNFPARNRVISGLSLGVIVVEAGEKSGALITADFALEQGREVFAVPGLIHSPMSKGPHKLIKQGAKLTESAADILSELNIDYNFFDKKRTINNNKEELNLSEEEKQLLSCIEFTPIHKEVLILRTDLSPSKINEIILKLQLKGMISQIAGGYVIRN
ncbi:MAG: DNA-processing protein DprA [Thermovenabulum sp.]|uniref:DNA-processing protein DprA n=1 Tax=Thermovenabulum sp. TaxID=3100335 RepID=UPI003C7CC677